MIRFAAIDDSDSLRRIYAPYIDTPITFECELPTELEFKERVRAISSQYPYLVCEEGGRPVGYAYAHRQRERAAYQWNAELSVYLEEASTSKGLGKKLYCILIEMLRLQGIRNVYGSVTMPNEKSERLHLGLGFECLGIYHKTGYKCGGWHDVAWFEKKIAPYDSAPAPILPIGRIPSAELQSIIQKYR